MRRRLAVLRGGVSTRRVDDVAQAMAIDGVCKSQVYSSPTSFPPTDHSQAAGTLRLKLSILLTAEGVSQERDRLIEDQRTAREASCRPRR